MTIFPLPKYHQQIPPPPPPGWPKNVNITFFLQGTGTRTSSSYYGEHCYNMASFTTSTVPVAWLWNTTTIAIITEMRAGCHREKRNEV